MNQELVHKEIEYLQKHTIVAYFGGGKPLQDARVIARKTCPFCCVFNSTHDFFGSTLKLGN